MKKLSASEHIKKVLGWTKEVEHDCAGTSGGGSSGSGGSSSSGNAKLKALISDNEPYEIDEEFLQGITELGDWAFYTRKNLTKLTIPETVTKVGKSILYNASTTGSCKELIIKGTNIGTVSTMFNNSGGLQKVTTNQERLGYEQFYGCRQLVQVVLSENCKQISQGAFAYCEALETFTVPSSVTTIVNYAFQNCKNLSSITLLPTTPPELKGGSVFSSCTALAKIIVPKGSLDAYKSATNWSTYADIMEEEA